MLSVWCLEVIRGSVHKAVITALGTRGLNFLRQVVMKTEVMKYQALADSIKSFEDVLCAVLTNLPNSYPSESLFSIFNATYNDDQKKSHTDYIELSMQSQFNKRGMR